MELNQNSRLGIPKLFSSPTPHEISDCSLTTKHLLCENNLVSNATLTNHTTNNNHNHEKEDKKKSRVH